MALDHRGTHRTIPCSQNSEISALRHNKTEEDILKEFNSIISKSQGADIKETTTEEDKKKKKKPAKAKKKVKLKVDFEPYDLEKHGTMATFPGLPDYEEIERYWVIEPYSFVVILYNESANTYLYYVCEPSLTVFEKELLEDVYQRLQDLLILSNIDVKADRKEVLVRKATEIIVDYIGKVDTKSYHKIIYYIIRDYLEFGKITPIMHDNFIEDISNNGFDTPIFLYHKNYENIMTNISFAREAARLVRHPAGAALRQAHLHRRADDRRHDAGRLPYPDDAGQGDHHPRQHLHHP